MRRISGDYQGITLVQRSLCVRGYSPPHLGVVAAFPSRPFTRLAAHGNKQRNAWMTCSMRNVSWFECKSETAGLFAKQFAEFFAKPDHTFVVRLCR